MIMAIVGLVIGACLGFLAAGLCHAAGESEPGEVETLCVKVEADLSDFQKELDALEAQLQRIKDSLPPEL